MKKLFIIGVFFLFFFLNLVAKVDLSEGLLAYYPFNNGAIDESCNGHDGSAFGNVTFNSELVGPAAFLSKFSREYFPNGGSLGVGNRHACSVISAINEKYSSEKTNQIK